MKEQYRSALIGKEVWIYPGDTYKKKGIILDIGDNGILFEITYYSGNDGTYVVGKLHWISFSANLSFQVV